MEKCLVTKLRGSVENAKLSKLGEIEIVCGTDKEASWGSELSFTSSENMILSLSNGSFFKGGENVGDHIDNTKEFRAYAKTNEGDILSVRYKYNIINFMTRSNYLVDLASFKYSKSLETLECYPFGDIEDLKNCKKLKKIKLLFNKAESPYSGNISNLADCPLEEVALYNCTGNLSALANSALTLRSLLLVVGDISGSIDFLKDSKVIKSICISYGSGTITGDLSQFAAPLLDVEFTHYTNACTWKGTRSSDKEIISMTAVNFGDDVDAMLINQAQCVASESKKRQISVFGNRTSASDSAIEALQQKGYTVSVG